MRRALLRALRLTLSPGEEWRVVASEGAEASALLWGFVLPLSCIPAASWTLNRLLLSGDALRSAQESGPDFAQSLAGGLAVYASTVLSVGLLATSLFTLAPLFDRARNWPRAWQVAACSGAPLFLGGVLLALPGLAYLLLPAAFQSGYLLYGGLQQVLGVREDRAAEFVALATVLLIFSSTLLGGLGSALGLL